MAVAAVAVQQEAGLHLVLLQAGAVVDPQAVTPALLLLLLPGGVQLLLQVQHQQAPVSRLLLLLLPRYNPVMLLLLWGQTVARCPWSPMTL